MWHRGWQGCVGHYLQKQALPRKPCQVLFTFLFLNPLEFSSSKNYLTFEYVQGDVHLGPKKTFLLSGPVETALMTTPAGRNTQNKSNTLVQKVNCVLMSNIIISKSTTNQSIIEAIHSNRPTPMSDISYQAFSMELLFEAHFAP